ncbi:transglutaminase domain-containing protein [Mediterraneibacter sp. ICN-202921]|uniref:transglutaminase domain-containing protein n=1 Tax=Mediterraneibacter sp. ICN-202921 TaxID=3134657 RepID=UPI0026B55D3A
MKIKYARYICTAAAVMLITGCSAGGSTGNDSTKKNGAVMETKKLAEKTKEKYVQDEKYEYTEPIKDVGRDEKLTLQMGFDIKGGEFTEYTQIVNVYKDAQLTQAVGSHFEWDEETQVLSVTPPRWETAGIASIDLGEEDPGYHPSDGTLFDKGELNDWGNLPQYYMVQYVDCETGEALAKPKVTVFKVKHEVEKAPKVNLTISEDGKPVFTWKPIKGAERYYVMSLVYNEDSGFSGSGLVRASTDETEWTPESNGQFVTYAVSEADRSEQYYIEEYGEGTEAIPRNSEYDTYYCVIAASEDGTSAISNTFDVKDIARKVPYTEEVGMSLSEEGSNYTEGFEEMPAYKWVTMCDGTLVQKLVNYDFDKAKQKTETWGEYEKADMSDLRLVEVDIVEIPYTIDGTDFTGTVVVENYDPDTWEEDLEEIHKRQEKLRGKGGAIDIEMTEEQEEAKEDTEQVQVTEYPVTANSALSEYLAVNMMSGNMAIDLSEFPESSDQEYLLDAWEEAVYQNPMVLGVQSASISADGKTLSVQYDIDTDEISQKQEKIAAEVQNVIKEIITEDMTELEKELAINQYLCDTAEYDMDALENAEENNFVGVDEKFNDAFTPYGVLLNKKGVCSSYAGAFKLLADAAGLESIIVTGNLDGDLPHAWNKVKIEGQWQIVDSTNNDNELIFNALLNLPDNAAKKVLVEDTRYALDSKVKEYEASTDENEYYHIEEKFYGQEEIVTPVTEALEEEGSAVFRTDYNLNDEEFMEIAEQVITQYGSSDVSGTYWMGVIYLTN